ncbi:MAG TPA: ATP-dependent helicase, partial [bacterium (Candidatus Stahlbacteria)]|nr:ATP-dependent helicase [Candidatus Stahlbacteria bacterium]
QVSISEPAGRVLLQFLKDKGYFKRLMADGISGEVKAKNISRFFDVIQRLSGLLPIDRVNYLVEMIDGLRRGGENPPVAEADLDIDAVNIMTVHSAKGKEFKVVFVTGLNQGNFPSDPGRRGGEIEVPEELLKEKLPRTSHLSEERRLFYVAITRARDRVFLTGCRDVGQKRPREPSQFIAEAFDLHKRELEVLKRGEIKDLKISDEKPVYRERRLERITPNEVDDYLTCPLKYKFIHILRIPVRAHHTVVFGKAVHEAIAFFLKGKIRKRPPDLDRVIQQFRSRWSSEGFISREHEELSFQRGIRVITEFYQRELELPPPSLIEEPFSFPFGDLRIEGRWDRVDLDDEVVIDYKTSENVDQRKADAEARNSIQLAIYALAYKAVYGKAPERTELHFVDNGIIGRMRKIGDKIKKSEQRIATAIEGIRRGDFQPRPVFKACAFCPFNDHCPYEGKQW